MILQGNEGRLAQLQGSITPQPVIKALKRLAKDTSVKAVVLRIDSPGGSATASDLIWRQIKKLAQKKPTIASLGRVAGSGGYYIAVAADEIIAHPETITGSIGVIAGKLSGGPLLDKLGIKVESMSEVEDNNLSSLAAPLTEPELTNLRRDIRAFYRRFIRCVAEGRQMSRQRVHRLGRGRVYTGSRALGVGLVDRLGGLQDAIDVACERAGLESRSAEVVFVDHKKTRRGIKTLVGGVSVRDAVVTQLIPGALTQHVLAATMLSRPNTLALMPSF
jgi:protease-4